MDIAIWLNLPDWLVAGQCAFTEHALWIRHDLMISLHLVLY